MTFKNALPGLLAGLLGLLAGFAAFAVETPLYGLVAGLLAIVAGLSGVRLARRLDEQAAVQTLIEAELQAMRASGSPLGREDRRKGERRSDDADGGPLAAATGTADHPAGSEGDEPVIVNEEDEDAAGADEALIDQATGLFSESFFLVALDSRIAAARRHLRPVAMVLLEVVEGLPDKDPSPISATLVADTVKETLREADTACRLRNGYFALLLEDTPENGAIWTVERIRRQLVETHEGLTVWAGVACYPAHAFTPNDILTASEKALVAAREWRQDRIEVAAAAE